MAHNGLTILVVEDNPGDAYLIQQYLSSAQDPPIRVEHCATLTCALERLPAGGLDAVLLDLTLPDSWGLDTLLHVRSVAAELPILILTGVDDEDLGRISVREGAQDFLVKGQVDTKRLVQAIHFAITRSAIQRQWLRLSLIDELTGLYNRRGFMTLAQQQYKLARRSKRSFVLLFADLDGLKYINDTLGHEAGDDAIRSAATVLRSTFRESDIIGRLGGDEFVVLSIDAEGTYESEAILNRLRENLQRFNQQNPQLPALSMSLGLAVFQPHKAEPLETLLQRADGAMYEEKQSRRPSAPSAAHRSSR